MVQKRLKSLKKSLRKPLRNVKVSSRQKTMRKKSMKQKSFIKKSKRKTSNKRSKRNSARFGVIPDEFLKYKNTENLGSDVDLYINHKLLENGVDDIQLTKSYRRLAMELHPDKNKTEFDLANRLFQRIDHNYTHFKTLNEQQRGDVLQNILKIKEKQMVRQMNQNSLVENSIMKNQREMERAEQKRREMERAEQKRREIARVLSQLKNLRERKEKENTFIRSFFQKHTEKMQSFERIEHNLLDELDMLKGFEEVE